MKALASSMLLLIALTACNRRDQQPVEPSTTTDTATVEAPASAPAGDTGGAMPDTSTPPNPTGACEGLTGQAQTDCLTKTGPNGLPPGAMPPSVNPATPSAPPAGTTEAPPADAGAPPPPAH